ncbi:MAG: hypothetical protein PVG66_13265 [Chromatiales bacterium]|jgi:hypothetical protein
MALLRIASVGWQHAGWDNSYYPEDIPADWKLSYYANDFRAVVVPQQDWLAIEADDWETLLDDVDEQFRFYLALDSHDLSETQLRIPLDALSDQLGGFLLKQTNAVPLESTGHGDVPFIGPCTESDSQQETPHCWLDLQTERPCRHDVVWIRERYSLPELRSGFERLQAFFPEQQNRLVVVDLAEPDTAYMQEIRTLLELMGIA